jgi:hypothetical protein
MKKQQAVKPLSDDDCRVLEGRVLFDSHGDPVARDPQGRPPPFDKHGALLARDAQGRPLPFYRPLPPGSEKRKGK